MKHIVAKLLALIALACSLATTARAESFARRVDIGGGRMMYIECHGSGSPTVLLISGTDTASDLWHAADQKGPTVYDDIQKTTRVCAYDRPGAPHLDQTFSRSDPGIKPLLVHVGRSFITDVTLQAGADVKLQCVSYWTIPQSTLLAQINRVYGTAGRIDPIETCKCSFGFIID